MVKEYDDVMELVAKYAEEKGKEEGREEGEAKGRKEGEAKGRKEGEANGKKKTIVSLFKDGSITRKKAMTLLNVTLQEFSELLTLY